MQFTEKGVLNTYWTLFLGTNNTIKMIQRIILIVFVLVQQQLMAQTLFQGQVKDSENGNPVEFCSIAVLAVQDSSATGGVLTDSLGNFEFTATAPFILRLSAIGYVTTFIQSTELKSDQPNALKINRDVQNMDDVFVRGEASEMVFKLDKRVFNVGKDLSNSGGRL